MEFLASEPQQRPHLQTKAVQVMCLQQLGREKQEPPLCVLIGKRGSTTLDYLDFPLYAICILHTGDGALEESIKKNCQLTLLLANGCRCGHVHGKAPVKAKGQGWEFVSLYCGFRGLNSVHETCVANALSA